MPDSPPPWRDRLAAASAAARSLSPARLAAAAVAVAGVAVAVAVAVVAARGAPAPPEVSLPRAAAPAGGGGAGGAGAGGAAVAGAPAEGDPPAYVHAAGAVARPGVYRVRAGGRVVDVVDAAGGPQPDADLDRVNLAARVGDGERVYVPARGEAAPPAEGGTGGGPGAGPVDLNTATLDQLDALPGVGPATAQAILDHRTEHGRFASVEELLEVRGIGDAKLAALRSRVRV